MIDFTNQYDKVRLEIRTGDIFAFGGKGNFSELIKTVTRANVSHVGVALVSAMADGGERVQIVESTSLDGFSGVCISQTSKRLPAYDGEVWWLPLGGQARAAVNQSGRAFEDFLLGQIGKPYDMSQAVKAGIDLLDRFGPGHNREDFSKLFCSELAAAALENVQAFGPGISINCAEVTPIDLCMFQIYAGTAPILLKGDPKTRIRAFNTLPVPDKWGD